MLVRFKKKVGSDSSVIGQIVPCLCHMSGKPGTSYASGLFLIDRLKEGSFGTTGGIWGGNQSFIIHYEAFPGAKNLSDAPDTRYRWYNPDEVEVIPEDNESAIQGLKKFEDESLPRLM
jgi:hypothetical protein